MALRREHGIAHIKFSRGYIECNCGWSSQEPGNYDEVADRFAAHRRDANAVRDHRGIGREPVPSHWGRKETA